MSKEAEGLQNVIAVAARITVAVAGAAIVVSAAIPLAVVALQIVASIVGPDPALAALVALGAAAAIMAVLVWPIVGMTNGSCINERTSWNGRVSVAACAEKRGTELNKRLGIVGNFAPACRWLAAHPNARHSLVGLGLMVGSTLFPFAFLNAKSALAWAGLILVSPNPRSHLVPFEIAVASGFSCVLGLVMLVFGMIRAMSHEERGPEQQAEQTHSR